MAATHSNFFLFYQKFQTRFNFYCNKNATLSPSKVFWSFGFYTASNATLALTNPVSWIQGTFPGFFEVSLIVLDVLVDLAGNMISNFIVLGVCIFTLHLYYAAQSFTMELLGEGDGNKIQNTRTILAGFYSLKELSQAINGILTTTVFLYWFTTLVSFIQNVERILGEYGWFWNMFYLYYSLILVVTYWRGAAICEQVKS